MTRTQLEVDMISIIDALTIPRESGMTSFLDRETGQVVCTLHADLAGLDEDEEIGALIEAHPDRFLKIERIESREQYEWMVAFAHDLDEPDVVEHLDIALQGNGAFRRFRDVLCRHPDLRDRWFAFEREQLLSAAVQQLRNEGIEPVYTLPTPTREVTTPPARSPRVELVDLLLLGARDGKDELIGGQVLRRIGLASPAEARGLFKRLAREICERSGVGWRKRFIEGKSTYDLGRMHLSVRDASIELRVDVETGIWEMFAR